MVNGYALTVLGCGWKSTGNNVFNTKEYYCVYPHQSHCMGKYIAQGDWFCQPAMDSGYIMDKAINCTYHCNREDRPLQIFHA